METTSITRTETCQDNKTTVVTDTVDDKTVTTTCVDNTTTTKTSNQTINDPKSYPLSLSSSQSTKIA